MLPNYLHFDRICRICLTSTDELLQLFNYEDGNIANILVSLATISVTADDDLPRNICTFCAHQAKSVHYFILKCQESDRKLRHSLNEFRKFDKIEETLDKIDYDDQNDANDTDDQDLNDPKESEPIKSSSNLLPENVVGDGKACEAIAEKTTEIDDDHSVKGKSEKLHFCLECLEGFSNNDLLADHMAQHQTNETKAKATSNDSKTDKKNIDRHGPQNFCSICNKNFASYKNLERHKVIHEKDKSQVIYKCQICGKEMKHVNHLNVHMRTHRDSQGNPILPSDPSSASKKQFLCTECGNACSSRSNLAVHMRRHSGKMTNFCSVCGKGYPRSTDLTVHMRKHTGEKPFLCNVCNKGFARSDKLNIHIRIHTGEKPYTCGHCLRAFAQSNDLASHKRRNACGAVETATEAKKDKRISANNQLLSTEK